MVEHADDVRMRQRLRLVELALELGQRFRTVVEVDLQHLDRDVARGVRKVRAMPVERLVDGAAVAAAEDREQLVAIAQNVFRCGVLRRRRSARRLLLRFLAHLLGRRTRRRIEIAAEQRGVDEGRLDVRGLRIVLGDELAPARAGGVERRLGRIARRCAGLIGVAEHHLRDVGLQGARERGVDLAATLILVEQGQCVPRSVGVAAANGEEGLLHVLAVAAAAGIVIEPAGEHAARVTVVSRFLVYGHAHDRRLVSRTVATWDSGPKRWLKAAAFPSGNRP
jgi:hypothetical protein